ncbi:hypothetical protein F4861DRAFT_171196 [Xylaria intraflava]|nr:hypothetical protein F4861DRAFT_171196 [Xylaria intraflava]
MPSRPGYGSFCHRRVIHRRDVSGTRVLLMGSLTLVGMLAQISRCLVPLASLRLFTRVVRDREKIFFLAKLLYPCTGGSHVARPTSDWGPGDARSQVGFGICAGRITDHFVCSQLSQGVYVVIKWTLAGRICCNKTSSQGAHSSRGVKPTTGPLRISRSVTGAQAASGW